MEETVSVAIAPDRILRELADLWTAEGKLGDAGVLRACSMTLCLLAEASDDAAALGETLAALMPEHPARAIVIRLSGAGERALAERVYQQCWKPFGQRRQICCEQIEITASDAALADLPSVLLPLAVPDLPVVLWCRSPRVAQRREFRDLARIATKVIFDTVLFSNPADAVWQLADAQRRGVLAADLAWTRLTPWREALARLFENREYLERLAGVRSVAVSWAAGAETAAWYLAAWISNAMRVAPALRGGASAMGLELTGAGLQISLTHKEGRLVTTVDGESKCASMPAASDYLLLREELAIMRRDPVFEGTLALAARLAVSSSSEQ
jgi:glucose-6-phosphate dehydrogenase assembly protein OpcA